MTFFLLRIVGRGPNFIAKMDGGMAGYYKPLWIHQRERHGETKMLLGKLCRLICLPTSFLQHITLFDKLILVSEFSITVA